MAKYLDLPGLKLFWDKAKAWIETRLLTKAEKSHTHDTYATKAEVNAKANDADVVKNTMKVAATKLNAGTEPKISYDKASNTLTVGIPKGDTGDPGTNGTNGVTPTISATATVDNATGTPTVTVTKSGADTTPSFAFAFKNLKGAKGDPGVNATTTAVATQSANGLMSAADKKKLDGIAAGANNYTLPTASASTLGGVMIGSGVTISSGIISVTPAGIGAAASSHTHADMATQTWVKSQGYKTTDSNTTYTFAGGNGSFTVTPSGSSAQTVSIGKPATAGTADTANSVATTSSGTLKFWTGTMLEYNSISSKDSNTLYIIK